MTFYKNAVVTCENVKNVKSDVHTVKCEVPHKFCEHLKVVKLGVTTLLQCFAGNRVVESIL